MVSSLEQQLADELTKRRAQHLYRTRRIVSSPQAPEIIIDNKRCLSFCSNDYLGLANHPQVIKALQQGADQYGVGSGASHLISGHTLAHHALEEELAAFVERPRALLFSTGYMANLGIMSALLSRGDGIFEDRLNHASLIDAGLLSGARMQRYQHADTHSLQQLLQSSTSKLKLIATDGVFSMDGDIAPLTRLSDIAKQHNAWLMVDDAHGIGVIGDNGNGSVAQAELSVNDTPILMGTLGKALGTFGAFVAGSDELIETLIQQARSYIYTTALPAAIAEATRVSLHIARKESWRREQLNSLIHRFQLGATQLGLELMPSSTPIQPLMLHDTEKAVQCSNLLLARGFYVSAIRPPTVPTGTARLRITFSANHTEQHVDQLLDALSDVIGAQS